MIRTPHAPALVATCDEFDAESCNPSSSTGGSQPGQTVAAVAIPAYSHGSAGAAVRSERGVKTRCGEAAKIR